MKIKICGITRLEDARAAADLGVDALGFIFYPQSPRYIAPVDALKVIKKLPPFISKVGVFVDECPQKLSEIIQVTGIDTVQLHGGETPLYCASVSLPVVKVFSVRDSFDASVFSDYDVAGYLLDTWDPERRGGSGRVFDWSAAVGACAVCGTVILSGGLGPQNILEAVGTVRPYAVDVNSGVESSPGVKDIGKMREIVSIVRKSAI